MVPGVRNGMLAIPTRPRLASVLAVCGCAVGLRGQGTFVFSNRIRLTSAPIRLCDAALPIDSGQTVHVRVFNPGNGTFNEVLRGNAPFTGIQPTNGFFNAGTLTVPFLAPGASAELEIEIRESWWFPGMGPGSNVLRVPIAALGGGVLPAARLPALPGRWSYGAGYRMRFPSGNQVAEGSEIPVVLEGAAPYQEFQPYTVLDPPPASPGLLSPMASVAPGLVTQVGFPPVTVTNLVLGEWKGTLTNLTYRPRPGAYGTDAVVTGVAGGGCTLAIIQTANLIEVLPDPRRPFLVASSRPDPAAPSVRFRGLAGQARKVESSTDLVHWTLVGTFMGTTGEVEIPGSGAGQDTARFYRLGP